MIRSLKILILRLRIGIREAEIDHAQDLIADHRIRLQNCQDELRRLKQQEAMILPASTLLEQALRRKA